MIINIEKFLLDVEKPVQYLGNELNAVMKEDYKVHACLIYPDLYEIGMSNMGIQILYGVLNRLDGVYAERAFAPGVDMEEILRREKLPLFSLETHSALNEFDFIGFNLSYEMTYTNVLNMIDLAGISVRREERKETDPIIVAGGTGAYNPKVLQSFIDCFAVGEGEEVIEQIADVFMKHKEKSRDEKLKILSEINGVYVPKYSKNKKVTRRIVEDFENCYFPDNLLVPFIKVVHDRVTVEIQRGCTRGCRFCQAGTIYRPVRERSVEKNTDIISKCIDSTGHTEVSLSSLSSGDYSKIGELIKGLKEKFAEDNLTISLPSLRIDDFSVKIAKEIEGARKTGFTFAPEAGSQRMRNIINKGINEEDIINTAVEAFKNGWRHLKFYFMIGLPFENDDDVVEIYNLAKKVLTEGLKVRRDIEIVVSVSNFVPKGHTPFQWDQQINVQEMLRKHIILKELFRREKKLKLKTHDRETSYLEGFLSRGDEKIGEMIYTAWKKGAKFDGWREHFKYSVWMEAMAENGITEEKYFRERTLEEELPWDMIDSGVDKKYLILEREQALKEVLTPDCRDGCTDCGLCGNFGVGVKLA